MKTFITSLFLFLTISIFAQPQKGDLYLGLSNLGLSSTQRTHNNNFSPFNQTTFFIAPSFGKFITDNTLLGGGFSFFADLSSRSVGVVPVNPFAINLFGAQYFGKGQLKGLGQIAFNANLSRNDFFNINRRFTGDLGLGGAYFVNEFTSMQLLYNINIFNVEEGFDAKYFSTGIKPNFALSLRTFLLRNREGIENLSALNSIKKGTTLVNLSARFRNGDDSNSRSYIGGFEYFIADNLYGEIGFSSSLNKGNQIVSEFSSSNISLGAGYYLPITERFYSKFALGMNIENQFSKSLFNGTENILRNTNIIRWHAELGVAIFAGRHKLEPGVEFRSSSTRLIEFGTERFRDFSLGIGVKDEWFLAENFAFVSNLNIRFNDVFFSILSGNFPPFEPEVIGFSQNNIRLNVGFKWYLSTPTE